MDTMFCDYSKLFGFDTLIEARRICFLVKRDMGMCLEILQYIVYMYWAGNNHMVQRCRKDMSQTQKSRDSTILFDQVKCLITTH